MSKFMCSCGEVIRDQTDHLPYKGHVISDCDSDDVLERIAADVGRYIESRVTGSDRKWLDGYFNKRYPSLKDEEVVYDIISSRLAHVEMDMYQCSSCGRLHVERRDDKSRLDSFAPDSMPARDIFRKRRAA